MSTMNNDELYVAALRMLPSDTHEKVLEVERTWSSTPRPDRLYLLYGYVLSCVIETMMSIDEEMDGLLAWCDINKRHGSESGYLYEFEDHDDYMVFKKYVDEHKKYIEEKINQELHFFILNCINTRKK